MQDLSTSEKIRILMLRKKMNLDEIAKLVNLTDRTVSSRLHDNKWKLESLKKLATHFKVTVKDLV
jgi:transcriptional regulator with XRE-family HTH domain